MLSFIYWNPAPVLFHIGSLSVRWYSLCWCAALLLGYIVMGWLYKKQKLGRDKFEPIFLYIFVGVLVGARLGHCLFYEPGYFLHHIIEMLLPIKQDMMGKWHLVGYEGLSSHGGVIGMLLAIWLYSRRYGVNIVRVLDNMGITAPLSACCIRMGNLFNSEIVGNATDMPWGFVFAHNGEAFARHPAQLYEALFYLLTFVAIMIVYKRFPQRVGKGFYFGLCLTAIFTFRILVEFLKADQEAFEAGMLLNMGQILSIPLVIIGIYFMAGGKWCRKIAEK